MSGKCTKLLANCGSWVACGKTAFKQLNLLQNTYLWMVYACPPSTPVPALRALARVWDIEHKVALEKVCLVFTVLQNREQNIYTRELLEEEQLHSWGGITQEVKDNCQEMRLPDATQQYVSRREAKEAMSLHHLTIVKREMEGKIKCDQRVWFLRETMEFFLDENHLRSKQIKFFWGPYFSFWMPFQNPMSFLGV